MKPDLELKFKDGYWSIYRVYKNFMQAIYVTDDENWKFIKEQGIAITLGLADPVELP
jgi:hypothetical protein